MDKPGYELFKQIEFKPLKELKGYEIRILNTCSVYTNPNEIDACVRGFFDGTSFGKELSQTEFKEFMNKYKLW